MKSTATDESGSGSLRARVEAQLKAKGCPGAAQFVELDSLRLLHELQVHQVELELQNEELMRTRSELETSLLRYTQLYREAPAAYLTLDPTGRISRCNKAAEAMLGLRLNGERQILASFLVPGDRPAFIRFMAELRDAPEGLSMDCELTDLSGRHLFVQLTACRQALEDACLVMIADLTALREADRERERLQMQLWQAQKMETVGRLAGGIAHDLNNMHCAGLLVLSMLENCGDLGEDARRMLGELKGLSLRSSTLTQQLLLFSRKSPLRLVPADLNQVVRTALQMLRRIIGDSYTLEFLPADRPLPACMDESKIQQVLMNLVVNARDAMPSGGRLGIVTRALDFPGGEGAGVSGRRRQGSYVSLEVEDAGCGIRPELLATIFEPFFTTKEVGRGTGLGLSVVDGIVNQHKGWVEVRSQEGSGSIFTIYLPRLEGALPPSEPEAARVLQVAGRGELLLLVEDEPLLRLAAVRSLLQLGYRVLEASTAAEALQLWEQNPLQVQLLITDMSMPGDMSGLELTRRLQLARPGLPVILMSGYSPELLGLGQVPGLSLLEKPFTVEQLTNLIRQALFPE